MGASNGMQVRWLDCQLDKGMFSDEVSATYPSEGTVIRSVFVPSSETAGKPGEKGRVRVRVMNRSGKLYAILPTPQTELVLVCEEDLSDAP